MLPVLLWADCAFCLHPFSHFTKCLPWTGAMLLLLGIDIWFKSLLHWKKWVVKSWNQGKSMKTSRDYNVECKVLLILAIPEIGIFNHFDQPSNNNVEPRSDPRPCTWWKFAVIWFWCFFLMEIIKWHIWRTLLVLAEKKFLDFTIKTLLISIIYSWKLGFFGSRKGKIIAVKV